MSPIGSRLAFGKCSMPQVRAFGKCSRASQGSLGQAGQTRFLKEIAPKQISITNLFSERKSIGFTFSPMRNGKLCSQASQGSQSAASQTRFLKQIAPKQISITNQLSKRKFDEFEPSLQETLSYYFAAFLNCCRDQNLQIACLWP